MSFVIRSEVLDLSYNGSSESTQFELPVAAVLERYAREGRSP